MPDATQLRSLYLNVNAGRAPVDLPDGVISLGGIQGDHAGANTWYVKTTGNDTNGGKAWTDAFLTVQKAVTSASAGDRIGIGPGEYVEAVTIARAKSKLTLIGVGGRGSVFIAPTATNATAMTNEADDVTFINIGMDGDGTGHACVNRGRRTRWYGCKIEGGTDGLRLTLGTNAQITAATHGKGDDLWIVDCELAFNTNGFMLVNTDYGAVTQVRFRECTFHDNTQDGNETNGAGGTVSILYRDLDIGACHFLRKEDGAEPTNYLILNDANGNKGVVWGCTFPTALAGGKNLVSTGLIWTGNLHTGGISTGQPS